MKNYDLLWAREHSGLTQAQAAKKMSVSREAFCRWETGRVKMPKRRWFAFLRLMEIAEASLPKRIPYDAKGYPLTPDDFGNDEKWDDEGARDKALEALEGDEYAARERERYRLLFATAYTPAQLKEEMTNYDAREAARVERLKAQALVE